VLENTAGASGNAAAAFKSSRRFIGSLPHGASCLLWSLA
jgi:hypothetical protein